MLNHVSRIIAAGIVSLLTISAGHGVIAAEPDMIA